jgi:hypothetical protein
MQQIIKSLFPLIILVLMGFISCESIFESIDGEFEKTETTMGPADVKAKASLSDYSVTISSAAHTTSDLYTFYQGLEEIRVNDGYYTYDTTVYAPSSFTIDTLLTSYNVVTPSDTTISYLRLDNAQKGHLVVFLTDYANIKLYRESSGQMTEVKCSDDNIPIETSAGFFTVSADGAPLPIIKARYEFVVENIDYLIEVITDDQTLSKTFKAALHFE